MNHASDLLYAASLARELNQVSKPPEAGGKPKSYQVLSPALASNTRPYIESTVNQINGTYEAGYYDACCVMIRRLIETVIIEAFEAKGDAASIKNAGGDFLYLGDLIDRATSTTNWNVSRNTKAHLRKLKNIGDKSAHNRFYRAHRSVVDEIKTELFDVVQEFLSHASLK